MPGWLWAILIVAGVLVLAIVWVFNRMVALRVRARNAWSDIDVQLKRRGDLVPSLVEVVKGYAAHERQTLEEATAARAHANDARSADPPVRGRAENNLTRGIVNLFALAEAYPDLKADESFHSLHTSLIEIEEHLQSSRRYYNAVVRDYNTLIEQFPHALVAGAFGFRPREFFSLETAAEAEAPRVSMEGDGSR